MKLFHTGRLRKIAGVVAGCLLMSMAGCASRTINAQSPSQAPYGGGGPSQRMPAQRQGLSTKQKVLLVAGAAALYYMYKKHQNAQGEGPNGRYFLSKNGRVYYRDMKTGQFHWVDPPTQPMQVPADEYSRVTGQSMDNYNGGVIQQAPSDWPGNRAYAPGPAGPSGSRAKEDRKSAPRGRCLLAAEERSIRGRPGAALWSSTPEASPGGSPSGRSLMSWRNVIGGILDAITGHDQDDEEPQNVEPSSQDPYGDPGVQGAGYPGGVASANQDPYGDPADQQVAPASQDPYGDPGSQ